VNDEPYDVYSVMDVVPRIVTSLQPGESRYLTLLAAFIGVASAAGDASDDPPEEPR
jgi:hypothetical protein